MLGWTMTERVLVVEDEPSIREALGLALGAGYELCLASTVEEALALPQEASAAIHLIYLDGGLGAGLSGRQALPLFRQRFAQARIVYTGSLGSLDVKDLQAAGASQVLPKPWDLSELLASAVGSR